VLGSLSCMRFAGTRSVFQVRLAQVPGVVLGSVRSGNAQSLWRVIFASVRKLERKWLQEILGVQQGPMMRRMCPRVLCCDGSESYAMDSQMSCGMILTGDTLVRLNSRSVEMV